MSDGRAEGPFVVTMAGNITMRDCIERCPTVSMTYRDSPEPLEWLWGSMLKTGRSATWMMLFTLLLALPGWGQTPSADDLVRLALAPKPSELYTMRADYDLILTVRYGSGGLLTTTARGMLTEWHRPRQPLHRSITIREMRIPLLLRPFSGLVQRVIKERIETQPDDLPDVNGHDFFLLDDPSKDQYVIGGVRRDIVTETLATYRNPGAATSNDPETRRAVAKWLFSSPTMKSRVIRSGPPYAMKGVVDAQGLLRAFDLFYNWGILRTQIAYAFINGAPVWNRLHTDVASDLPTLGRVTGGVTISLSNECLDCAVTGRSKEAPP
ncbi:MAG TPA: hypothetical protein VJT33_06815 [bacterium]|nr:hypothetical protein [bacterium]